MSSTSTISPLYYYPRRFLSVDKVHAPAPTTSSPHSFQTTFDQNVIMILAVLLCALICALGLNSIVRCALRCTSRVTLDDRCTAGGVSKKALKSIPTMTYSDGLQLPGSGSGSECAICLAEFGPGERVRVLPRCNHGFHVACVDRWLRAHSSCPTCRQCLTTVVERNTCQCAVQREVALNPLDPEDPFYDYRGHY